MAMRNEPKKAVYAPPVLEYIKVDVVRPFAISHVTTVESNVSVDEWGSSDNEVSFD